MTGIAAKHKLSVQFKISAPEHGAKLPNTKIGHIWRRGPRRWVWEIPLHSPRARQILIKPCVKAKNSELAQDRIIYYLKIQHETDKTYITVDGST